MPACRPVGLVCRNPPPLPHCPTIQEGGLSPGGCVPEEGAGLDGALGEEVEGEGLDELVLEEGRDGHHLRGAEGRARGGRGPRNRPRGIGNLLLRFDTRDFFCKSNSFTICVFLEFQRAKKASSEVVERGSPVEGAKEVLLRVFWWSPPRLIRSQATRPLAVGAVAILLTRAVENINQFGGEWGGGELMRQEPHSSLCLGPLGAVEGEGVGVKPL